VSDVRGMIFNIQRYSVHDGPGIRTVVFLKGCPFTCPWCSNPEGLSGAAQLAHSENLCVQCYGCIGVCPYGALGNNAEGPLSINRASCRVCGACEDACNVGAMKQFGRWYTVDELLEQVMKDAVFYRRSGGGITLSGGEPLVQFEFVSALLKRVKQDNILDTAIETTMFAPPGHVQALLPLLNTILCDIKYIDPARHKDVLGVGNESILQNIRMLSKERGGGERDPRRFLLRLPLIPGLNDDANNLSDIAAFILTLENPVPLEILPFHAYGKGKYRALGLSDPLETTDIQPPDAGRMKEIEQFFTDSGVAIVHT